MSEPTPPVIPDSDKTVIIPRPGSRRAPPPQQSADATIAMPAMRQAQLAREVSSKDAVQSGVNPLVAAANPLLNLVPQLRNTLQHSDPVRLRADLLAAITEFEANAQVNGVPPEHIVVARYAICTVLDEAVSFTPWGGTAQWAQSSLLVTLHKEGWGGEKFFQLLDKMGEDPRLNLDLLELMYVCLCNGFSGRYRVMDNGKEQLEHIRERLHDVIRKERGEFEQDLSPKWQGVARKPRKLLRKLPPWVVLAVSLFVLFGVFLALTILLNNRSDPVFSALAAIKANTSEIQRPSAPLAKPRLKSYLGNEIAQGLLEVQEDPDTSRVILHADNAFAAGSADIDPTIGPLLSRVAEALNQVPGSVTVTGHTDDRPIRSLRFPSNYHLSLQRASNVARLLMASLKDRSRIHADGMGEAQPIASNDTPANRARNRRVEILLRVAH